MMTDLAAAAGQADADALTPYLAAGVLGSPDVQLARALIRIGGTPSDNVALAIALCARALREGSVCVDLRSDPAQWAPADAETEATELVELSWPGVDAWLADLTSHPLVSGPDYDGPARPLKLVGDLLYLYRYWRDEELIADQVRARATARPIDIEQLRSALDENFESQSGQGDVQRLAAASAAISGLTVIAGGPGTGKTTTVARLLVVLREVLGADTQIALAAPTGKAAARMTEALKAAASQLEGSDRAWLDGLEARTLHRLLGAYPGDPTRIRHNESNPLPHDVVIVDETSMVPLQMMARLMSATRADARLILIGDPFQLASVEAGAVLGDVVAARPAGSAEVADLLRIVCPNEAGHVQGVVVELVRGFRFGGSVARLAAAVKAGDIEEALRVLRADDEGVAFHEIADGASADAVAHDVLRPEVRRVAQIMAAAAGRGDVADALVGLDAHRVLCAHRRGPYGVTHWSELVSQWTAPVLPVTADGSQRLGQALICNVNDAEVGIFNGDTGVVVGTDDGGWRAAFGVEPAKLLRPVQLRDVSSLNAMTIHRGQGSQFDVVSVILPSSDSPLLTRELFYTALTRARQRVIIIGSEASVRVALSRSATRASGLRTRVL